MTDRDKQFHDLMKQVAGKLAGECKCDNGYIPAPCDYDDGWLCGNHEHGIGDCYDPSFGTDEFKGCDGWTAPCPSCAKLRAIAAEPWHEEYDSWKDHDGFINTKCSCGATLLGLTLRIKHKDLNPHYNKDAIVATLKDLGLWERFVLWADITLARALSPLADCLGETNITYSDTRVMLADILTTDSLLLDAAISFLQEVVDNG